MVNHHERVIIWGIGICLTILLSLPILGLSWSFLTVSDQSLTEGYVLDVLQTGSFDGTYSLMKSWYTHPRLYPDGLVLHYPLYLYSIGVFGVGLIGQMAFWVLPILMVAGLVYGLYLLSKELLLALSLPDSVQYRIPVWLAGVAALAPSWLNGFRFELVFMLLTVAGLYWAIRMYRTRLLSDAVLSITMLSFAACIRQNYTLFMVGVLGVVALQSLLLVQGSSVWKKVLVTLGVPLVIIGSFYAVLIQTTGTISYYSESGYAVLDESIFQPKYLEFGELDQELNEAVDRSDLYDRFNSGFQNQYPSLRRLVETDGSVLSIYNRINQNLPMNVVGFLVLVLGASLVWIGRRSGIWYLMVGMGLPYLAIWLVYTSNPRYLHIQYVLLMLVGMTCVGVIVPILSRFQRQILGVLLAVVSVYGTLIPYAQDRQVIQTSYGKMDTPTSANAHHELMDWIEENTSQEDRIFTSLQREVSQHTRRETIWDARIWFVEEIELTIQLWDEAYQADYIIIDQDELVSQKVYNNPLQAVEDSTLYSLIQATDLFESVYERNGFTVYQYRNRE